MSTLKIGGDLGAAGVALRGEVGSRNSQFRKQRRGSNNLLDSSLGRVDNF